jgi:glycosyltransferase involved in cell wall biosynthesis
MDISVVVCTYNRSASLRRTLESIRGSFVTSDLEWELIIVDNNSEDDTRDVVETYQELCEFRIRYVKEELQGLSYARNRGINESKGSFIAFTDDDVIVDRNWIGNIVTAFAEYDVQCIGGRILANWEKPKPKWLSKELYGYLALLDYGDFPFYLDKPELWGGNLSFKAEAFQKYGLFDTNRGRLPNKLYGDEETHFLSKLLEGKEKILYLPNAIVHHCIPKERMRKPYFRKWQFDRGELHGILLGDCLRRSILGVPYYAIKELISNVLFFLISLLTSNENSFKYQMKVIYSSGVLIGRLKHKFR